MHFMSQVFLKLYLVGPGAYLSLIIIFSQRHFFSKCRTVFYVTSNAFFRSMWNTPREGEISKLKGLAVGFGKDRGKNRKKLLDFDKLMVSDENVPCVAEKTEMQALRNHFSFL